MEKYDYYAAVKSDLIEYVRNEWKDELDYDTIFEDALVSDYVTGNASGSYTFNTWQAEENLAHNWDLMVEAAEHFGISPEIDTGWKRGAEWWDVTIRCYVLGDVLNEALQELEESREEGSD